MTQPAAQKSEGAKWLVDAIEEVRKETLDWTTEFLRDELGMDMPDVTPTQGELHDIFTRLVSELDPVMFSQGYAALVDELGQEAVDRQIGLAITAVSKGKGTGP